MWWFLPYIPLTIGVVWLGHRVRHTRPDFWGAALVLALLWCLWNTSHWWMPHPYNQFMPFLDAFTCACMAWVWRNSYRPWKVALIVLFMASCLLHAEYFALGDHSHAAKYAYDLKQNVIYLGELLIVALASRVARR